MDGLALTRRLFDDFGDLSLQEISALTDVPLFLGYVFSYLLQGILVLQVFIYFIAFPGDKWWMKVTVGFLFFVECLSTFFATFGAVWSIVADGNLFSMAVEWEFRTLGPLCGIATLTVHAFYSWRILQVKGHWSIAALIILLSIAQCVMVIWSGTTSLLGIGADHPSEIAFVTVWLAGSAICDFIIAVSLLVLLPKAAQKLGKLGNAETQSRLERLMKFAVETGLITALGALSELFFYFLFRNTMIHYILFWMLPKIYSNCMLAALNARISSRALRTHDSEWGSQTSTIQESDRFVIGDGVFHIVNRDGKLVHLEEDVGKLSDEHEQCVVEIVDTNAPDQETFVPTLAKEPVVVAATARATAHFHPSTETLAVTMPKPLPLPEFSASDPVLRARSLPIPPIIVSFSDPVSSDAASAQQLYQPDPIPSVLRSRSFSEPVLPELGHKDPSISPDSPLVSRLHPFTFDVSDAPLYSPRK